MCLPQRQKKKNLLFWVSLDPKIHPTEVKIDQISIDQGNERYAGSITRLIFRRYTTKWFGGKAVDCVPMLPAYHQN